MAYQFSTITNSLRIPQIALDTPTTAPKPTRAAFSFDDAAFSIVTLLRAAHDLAGPVMAAHDELDANGGQTSRASRFEALLDLAERKALSIADAEGTAA